MFTGNLSVNSFFKLQVNCFLIIGRNNLYEFQCCNESVLFAKVLFYISYILKQKIEK